MVAMEHQASIHGDSRTGMTATCHDCQLPTEYPELLWYRAAAGTKDVIGEIRGVISTEEKFARERKRMAGRVGPNTRPTTRARAAAATS
jgi:nitrate/TMAO reductase-like tetraheme cytochrome c subunit